MWPEHEEPLPWKAKRWLLVERFGWTLEYAESLDALDYAEGMKVLDALDAARRAKNSPGGSE